jgi:predicted signal transduction protein with EAL and GGDEF domain
MADGFDIHLNEEQAQRLKAAAEASGVDAQAFALQVLEQAMDHDWAEDVRRIEEYERTGESISAEEWMQGLREAVHAQFKT